MTEVERLLRELIAIPSINPSLPSAGAKATGEEALGQFIGTRARRAGLDVDYVPVKPGRDNVFARWTPRGRVKARVLLAPHLDTVGVSEGAEGLLTPWHKGRRLYGRGACDTKGPMAAMITALLQEVASGRRPQSTEVVFVGLVDEECHQAGSRAVAVSGLKANLAIVGEPTRLKMVTSHKGVLWLRLHTRGKAAHGARPELGRNAVLTMARVVELLEVDYRQALRRRRHKVLGHPTINVGSIRGGRQPNIVPDECVLAIDRRTLPGETDRGVVREIQDRLTARGLAVRVERTQTGSCPPLDTDVSLPLVRTLWGVAGQRRAAGVDYFSDAAVLAGGGIPSVVFGPGDIAQAHTVDEWVDRDQLERATAMMRCFLRTLS